MENLHIRHILVKFHRLKNDAVYIVNSADIESTAYTEVPFKPSSFLFDKVANQCDQLEPVTKSAWINLSKFPIAWFPQLKRTGFRPWKFTRHDERLFSIRIQLCTPDLKRVILHTRLHQHPKNIACSQQLWTPTNLLIVEAAVWGAGDPSGEARGTLLSV